jgi:hypothetical protein
MSLLGGIHAFLGYRGFVEQPIAAVELAATCGACPKLTLHVGWYSSFYLFNQSYFSFRTPLNCFLSDVLTSMKRPVRESRFT